MFGFGKVPCVLCDRQVSRKEALRLRDKKDTVICGACYAAWEGAGRKCGSCDTPVRGVQEAGVFLRDRHGFGHADCGADRFHVRL